MNIDKKTEIQMFTCAYAICYDSITSSISCHGSKCTVATHSDRRQY